MGRVASILLRRGFLRAKQHYLHVACRSFNASKKHEKNYALHNPFPYSASPRHKSGNAKTLPSAIIQKAEKVIKENPDLRFWILQLVGKGDEEVTFKKQLRKDKRVLKLPKTEDYFVTAYYRVINYTLEMIGFWSSERMKKMLPAYKKPADQDTRWWEKQNNHRKLVEVYSAGVSWFSGEGFQTLSEEQIRIIKKDKVAKDLFFPGSGPLGWAWEYKGWRKAVPKRAPLALAPITWPIAAYKVRKMDTNLKKGEVRVEFTGRVGLLFFKDRDPGRR